MRYIESVEQDPAYQEDRQFYERINEQTQAVNVGRCYPRPIYNK